MSAMRSADAYSEARKQRKRSNKLAQESRELIKSSRELIRGQREREANNKTARRLGKR